MANIIKLTEKDIFDKEFEVEHKGYKVEEVDSFLDKIAEDYKMFNEVLEKKDKKLKQLKDEFDQNKKEHEKVMSYLKMSKNEIEQLTKSGLDNIGIIKRLANLEQNLKK